MTFESLEKTIRDRVKNFESLEKTLRDRVKNFESLEKTLRDRVKNNLLHSMERNVIRGS
jgi:hypothetical protein